MHSTLVQLVRTRKRSKRSENRQRMRRNRPSILTPVHRVRSLRKSAMGLHQELGQTGLYRINETILGETIRSAPKLS